MRHVSPLFVVVSAGISMVLGAFGGVDREDRDYVKYWACCETMLSKADMKRFYDRDTSQSALVHLFELEKSKTECDEIDELGGQPPISDGMREKSIKWVTDNFSMLPNRFLTQLPTVHSPQHEILYKRQHVMMDVLERLKAYVKYTYEQCQSYELELKPYERIAQIYKRLIGLSAWKDIGDRDFRRSKAACMAIDRSLLDTEVEVMALLKKILAVKKTRYQVYSANNPQAAQTAVAIQRAKHAEAVAQEAKEDARKAKLMADDLVPVSPVFIDHRGRLRSAR